MDGGGGGGVVGNLVHLLSFYTLERLLFNRMVGPIMGHNPKLVKMAVGFWLMLEEIGYHDLTRRIYSFDDSTIDAVFNETLECLHCIRSGASEPAAATTTTTTRHNNNNSNSNSNNNNNNNNGVLLLPVLTTILDEPISLRFFYYNGEFMLRRLVHVMDTVCNRIFGENSAIEVDVDDCDHPRSRLKSGIHQHHHHHHHHHHHGHGLTRLDSCEDSTLTDRIISPPPSLPVAACSSATTHRFDNKVQLPPIPGLNPNASEFFPRQSNQDSRTMFLTFSKGYPLTREEIINFFTSKWGDVVEDVLIDQAAGAEAPLYGRVVFNSPSIIRTILNGQSKAKFMVGRKHLWARVYVPRRR